MIYMYSTTRGKAVLNKGDDSPLKIIGQYKTEEQAKEACKRHFEKSCKALQNLGKPIPQILFF